MSKSVMLFSGNNSIFGGSNLWETDGTGAGTSVLRADIPALDFTGLGNKVLFNSSGRLWVTDGTTAGTVEIPVAGAQGVFGLNPRNLTVLGSEVLLGGWDTNQVTGLWVTNGTAAGTSELSVAGAYSGHSNPVLGLNPSGFTVLGSEALFAGIDANNATNLWVTDGTSAGTSELSVTGVLSNPPPGYPGAGLNPTGLTVLGSEALFMGYDANGGIGLWVTNGTAAGTSELSVDGAGPFNLFPRHLTVFGGEVLFEGQNASGTYGLWVTDGTAARTSELSVAGAHSGGLLANVYQPDITVFGSEVLFEGQNASGAYGLWVTNGTAAGTSELSLAGANANGVMPWSLTPFGSEVLFAGLDAIGKINLWVTNGTAAGTSELSVAGAGSLGLFQTENQGNIFGTDPGFTLFGSEVLFEGNDASGHTNLWVTDGTSAGTSELSVAGAPAALVASYNFATYSFSFPTPTVLTSVVASPSSGVEGVGQTVTITLGLNNAVTVSGGIPTLTLNDGGLAFYSAAATAALGDPTKLVFSYTVTAAEHNVGALTVQDGSLNGATLVDAAGHTPDFSGLATAFPGLEVVTAPPATVTSVTASPGSGTEGVGATITFTVSVSKAVTVAGGTPTLTLNDGGLAYYNAAATAALGDPTKLVFSYTVTASEHNVGALTVQDGSLNGATLVDAAGNTPDFSGLATAFPNLHVVTAAPATVTSVVASPSSGTEGAGQTITLTLTMSKAVTVSGGLPFLALNDAGRAIYDAAATAALGDPTKLVFDYTIARTDQAVPALAVIGGSFNGATITDASGKVPDFSGSLISFPGLQTTAAPVLISIVASQASGELVTGDKQIVTLNFGQPLFFTGGSPELLLNDGGTAFYDAARSTSTALAFDYTVGPGDLTTDLKISGLQSASAIAGRFEQAALLSGAGTDLGLQVNTTSTGPAGQSAGPFTIDNAQLALFGPSNAAVTFAPNAADVLILENSASFAGTVAGFAAGETILPVGTAIDFADINFKGSTLSYAPNADNTGGMLTVSDGITTANIALLGNYSATSFVKALDGSGHTLVENFQGLPL